MTRETDPRLTRRDFIALSSIVALNGLTGCAQTSSVKPSSAGTGAVPAALPVFKNEAAKARYMTAYDAVLNEWPVSFESIRCPTRYGVTHVVASGPVDAPPVLLMPALLATATSWRPNVAELSQRFRCYAVDVIGEVNKSEPTRALKNRTDCADWLTGVLDALRVERASFVGASLGGFFSLNEAVLKPERVERLVLIGPAVVLPMAMAKFMYYVGLAAIGIEKPMDDWMGAGIPWNPADNSSATLWAANKEGRGMINSMNLGQISDAEWRSVRAPTFLLIGDREVIYSDSPEETLKGALERIPGLQGELVPNANHLAARANPAFVNKRIVRFLAGEN